MVLSVEKKSHIISHFFQCRSIFEQSLSELLKVEDTPPCVVIRFFLLRIPSHSFKIQTSSLEMELSLKGWV